MPEPVTVVRYVLQLRFRHADYWVAHMVFRDGQLAVAREYERRTGRTDEVAETRIFDAVTSDFVGQDNSDGARLARLRNNKDGGKQ